MKKKRNRKNEEKKENLDAGLLVDDMCINEIVTKKRPI
jgi:hypothetical protein